MPRRAAIRAFGPMSVAGTAWHHGGAGSTFHVGMPGCYCCSALGPVPNAPRESSPLQNAQQAWTLATLPPVHGGFGLHCANGPSSELGSMDGRTPCHPFSPAQAADSCLAAVEQGAEGIIPCKRNTTAMRKLLHGKGWETFRKRMPAYEGAFPEPPRDAGLGEGRAAGSVR